MAHEDKIVENHEKNFTDIWERLRQLDIHDAKSAETISHLQEGYLTLIGNIKDMASKIDLIQNKLINRLPAWGNIMINALVALASALLMYVVTRGQK